MGFNKTSPETAGDHGTDDPSLVVSVFRPCHVTLLS